MEQNNIQIRPQILLEPIMVNRFQVKFPDFISYINDRVTSCNRPSWINGRWNPMTITLTDVIAPSTKLGLYDLITYLNENDNCTIFLEDLDPTGTVVSRWELTFTKEQTTINFGYNDMNWNQNLFCYLTFTPTNCQLLF